MSSTPTSAPTGPPRGRRATRRQGRRRKTSPQALLRFQPLEPAPATELARYPAPQLKEPS
ncbi:hypothetical protein TIFTF001_010537 [Ficus carica]|uniref:Uncharacterized protein n=1 Tax=Ficus carica TaxID=3494 RepID=A0AA88DHQ0_FICCA|nr:hypothetical protein TIFTF001_010537 [Ficus carica]